MEIFTSHYSAAKMFGSREDNDQTDRRVQLNRTEQLEGTFKSDILES